MLAHAAQDRRRLACAVKILRARLTGFRNLADGEIEFSPGVNLLLGAVTCSGKLSLVVEYAEEAVDTATMERIKDKAMEFLLEE